MVAYAFSRRYPGETRPLRRFPALAEVGNVAAFMASDHASPLTGTCADVNCGAILD
jgi:enoyl-[acyl-carrier-protein] reductase (NADH)